MRQERSGTGLQDQVSRLFEDSLALSAWKEHRGHRWSLRVNPSSGNLHPTEGYLLCGDPDEVVEQVRRYESVGCDQICFGMPLNMSWADAHETIRLVGEHVIPQIDKDPVHRSSRFREEAAGRRG